MEAEEVSFMAEVSMMVTLCLVPNGVSAGLMMVPKRLHVLVYLTGACLPGEPASYQRGRDWRRREEGGVRCISKREQPYAYPCHLLI